MSILLVSLTLKKQKTLLIFIPSIEEGGVEKNLFNITNFLVNKIKHIRIITANSNKKNKFNKKIKIICPKNDWNKSNRLIKTIISIVLLLKILIQNKNESVIFSFQSNLIAIILAKIFNSFVVIRSNAAPQGYSKNTIKKKIFSLILRFADQIIVNSKDFKIQLKNEFNINSICIYNPLENTNKIIKLSKKKIYLPFFETEDLKIISVGRLVKQKNHITILKAINLISKKIKIKLILLGKGDQKESLRKYIRQNKMEKIVKIIDFKKNPYPYIYKSDVFILSSLYEGLPNVLLEALSLKKYLLSSNCPTGPKEILNNQKYGKLFKVGDHVNLSKKILYCIKNKKEIRNHRYKNFDLTKYDFTKNCNSYFNTINKFLKK